LWRAFLILALCVIDEVGMILAAGSLAVVFWPRVIPSRFEQSIVIFALGLKKSLIPEFLNTKK